MQFCLCCSNLFFVIGKELFHQSIILFKSIWLSLGLPGNYIVSLFVFGPKKLLSRKVCRCKKLVTNFYFNIRSTFFNMTWVFYYFLFSFASSVLVEMVLFSLAANLILLPIQRPSFLSAKNLLTFFQVEAASFFFWQPPQPSTTHHKTI